ncbi:MAG: hypothetical protein KDK36_19340 [Leptospiraceae bacterium]|nr:hypothetical protein [Leptospiraceae bacterium]
MTSEKTIQIVKSLQLQCDISGKVDGLSFYKWKGKNVVRKIGKPSKPASPSQLECRKKFASLQNLSKIFKPIIQATYNTGKKPLTPANLFIKRNGEIFEKNEVSIGENSKDKLTSNRSYFESLSMTTYSKANCHPEQNVCPKQNRRERVTNIEISNNHVLKGLLDTKFISFRNKFHSKTVLPNSYNSNLVNTDKIRPSSEIPMPIGILYRDADDADYSKIKLTRSNFPLPFTPKLTKHSEEIFTLQWDDFTKKYDTIALILFSPEKGSYHKIEMGINENQWHIEIPEEFQNTNIYYYLYCYHSKKKAYSESITLTPEDGANILWKIHKQKQAITVTKDIYPWSVIDERQMLRFNNLFPFGCLRPTFDITFYQLGEKNLAISIKDTD